MLTDRALASNILGISRSPFHGSVEMTREEELYFLGMSFRPPAGGEKSLIRFNSMF